MAVALTDQETTRYARHLLLGDVGLEGQLRLKQASVLCVGAGGLGSPVLLYLATAGVGRIGICDFDVVDSSNLQRQVIHTTESVGRSKVESARQRLSEHNPHVSVDLYETRLSSLNALEILKSYDVIVDGTDNFATRYLVNDACVILGKPFVYGAILQFEGQASVFNYQGGPTYRDLHPEPPPAHLVPSCAQAGVLGVLPGVIGCIQATEVVKIILGLGETLSGRLLTYDALSMRFGELELTKNPSSKPVTELIDYDLYCAGPAETFVEIDPVAVQARMQAGWTPYVLDVRTPQESRQARLDFTDRLHGYDDVAAIAAELPRDRDILVYCKVGGRSAAACETLYTLGFRRLYNLDGGIRAWQNSL